MEVAVLSFSADLAVSTKYKLSTEHVSHRSVCGGYEFGVSPATRLFKLMGGFDICDI